MRSRASLSPPTRRDDDAEVQVPAVDLAWALSRAALYRELIDDRDRMPDQVEWWLAATLPQQLLGTGESPVAFQR